MSGQVLAVDGLALEFRRLRFGRDPHCTVCAPEAIKRR
jgi:hypothetical protein